MTLIKTNGLQISGTMGGTVFKRDRSGLHAIPYSRPLKRNPSTTQATRRKAYIQICSYIKKHRDANFIERWQLYANQHPIRNRLGETRVLTWFSVFIKYNINAVVAGEGVTPLPEVQVYHVSGDPVPDVTGNYSYYGIRNNKPSWIHHSLPVIIGWIPSVNKYWILISGPLPPKFWVSPTVEPEGVYTPVSPTTGNPEVISGWL